LNSRFVGGKEFWQKDKRKTIVLTAGRIDREKWDIRVRVSQKAKILGTQIFIEGRSPGIRDKDKHWFDDNLGKDFMRGKEIDHDWDNGALCRVLSREEHLKIERGRKEN